MRILIAILTLAACAACGSAPSKPAADAAPDWMRLPARTVDNGYIVYIGNGLDRAPEKSIFKAEAQALGDLANECSFVPKGARVEDRYQRDAGILHETFVKVAVEFQLCEQAKQAVDPQDVRKLANTAYSDEIKQYREQVAMAEPEPEPIAEPAEEAAETPATGTPAATRVAIHDDHGFFFWRQYIASQKELVILAPPATYAAGAPATVQYVHAISVPARQIQTYEVEHPALKTSAATFSSHVRSWAATSPTVQKVREARKTRRQRSGKPGHWHQRKKLPKRGENSHPSE